MFEAQSGATRLLILQCDSGDMHSDLIACARYNITNEHNQSCLYDDARCGIVHVLFIVQLPRIAGGCFVGFQVLSKVSVTHFTISAVTALTDKVCYCLLHCCSVACD